MTETGHLVETCPKATEGTDRHKDTKTVRSAETYLPKIPAKIDESGQRKRTRRRTNPETPPHTPTKTSP